MYFDTVTIVLLSIICTGLLVLAVLVPIEIVICRKERQWKEKLKELYWQDIMLAVEQGDRESAESKRLY